MLNACYCLSDNTTDRGNPLFWPFQCLFWPQRRGARGQANNSSTSRQRGSSIVPTFILTKLQRHFHSHRIVFLLFSFIPYTNVVLFRVFRGLEPNPECTTWATYSEWIHASLSNGQTYNIHTKTFTCSLLMGFSLDQMSCSDEQSHRKKICSRGSRGDQFNLKIPECSEDTKYITLNHKLLFPPRSLCNILLLLLTQSVHLQEATYNWKIPKR